MKTLLTLFVLLIGVFGVHGQTATADESVLVSSGFSVVQEGGSLDWVVGDNITDVQVLFGLQKSDVLLPALQEHLWVVGPVMTDGVIVISSPTADAGQFMIKIIDETSRTLLLTPWDRNPKELNLANFATGPYVVVICNEKDATFARFKIIKK